jgi:signal transduction histidine kinase
MPDIPETMILKCNNPFISYCFAANKLKDQIFRHAGGPALLFFTILISGSTFSQESPIHNIADIARVQTAVSLIHTAEFATSKRNSVQARDIPNLKISQKITRDLSEKLPLQLVEKTVLLRFPVENSSDSLIDFYFFPGMYCRQILLYKANIDSGNSIPELLRNYNQDSQNFTGFVRTSLGPKEKAVYYAQLDFTLTTQNKLSPFLIRSEFISYFKNDLLSNKITLNIFNYVTAGILLMMIIYAVSTYFQDYQIEFLYYSTYALSMGVLLFLKSFLYGSTSEFNYYFEGCLDFFIQLIGYSFYLLFIRKFLATKFDHPWLEKFLIFCNFFILGSLLVFGIFYFGTSNFLLTNLVENISKQFLLGFSIVFILYGIWRKDPLMNYIVAGQLLLTLFSIVSFLLIITTFHFSAEPKAIINDPLFYYQIGIILELVFFMSGLTYKNKRNLTERVKERERLKLENERKEFEKQVAILEAKQQERNRISADMHDELGSGVTAIRLMSEIVKAKMKGITLPEIDKISHSANELLGKMNTIIWTMVSSNDTVESLIAYIRAYAMEFFENTSIDCQFSLPIQMPRIGLSGEKRRNIFLSVKEALNNVLKHSQATLVRIEISISDKLIIEIADNGVGINMDQLRKFGNGLQNMKKRISSVGGEFMIRNNEGTRTIFELELD